MSADVPSAVAENVLVISSTLMVEVMTLPDAGLSGVR